ncbi:DUF4232 domain-containing protein [Streptomyces libani]
MTKRGLRTATVAAALALVAGASAGVASAAGTAGPGAAADVCRPGTLKVTTTDAGSSQVGMNHEGTYLKVTNTGNSTCAIGGYPGAGAGGRRTHGHQDDGAPR